MPVNTSSLPRPHVEAAQSGRGPKKFLGVIVATPPNDDDLLNVEYDGGETFATEVKHLTLVAEPGMQQPRVGSSRDDDDDEA